MKKIKFKAAILFKQKKNLKVIDIYHENKLTKGQILIKIISAAICGAQIGEIDGIKGPDKWLPHCMGHEGYGEVVQTYKNCKNFKKKDTVVLHWRKNNLLNAKPASYLSKYGKINAGNVTTFQEYAVISENRITKIPKTKNKKLIKLLPLLGCAIPTSWGILNKETNPNKNSKILIMGAGGIGITLAIILKIQGNQNIDIIDKFNKKKLLNKINLKSNKINFLMNKKKFYDYVYDTTGNVNNISKGFDCLNKNGNLVLVGQPKNKSKLLINDPLRLFNPPNDNINMISSDGGKFEPHLDMKKIYNLLSENVKIFSKLVSHNYKLEKINQGITELRKGNCLRVGIEL